MSHIWSDEYKYQTWLRVEIAVCEAWAEEGVIPVDAIQSIRSATFDLNKVAEYEREMHHDFNAFLRSVADSAGESARFIHFGLTSYDAEDTALGLRLKESAELLERRRRATRRGNRGPGD
jgi:adenylosuccinate lyase